MNRLLLLLGLSLRTRLRGFLSAGASSIFLLVGAAFAFAFTCAVGALAYFTLSQLRGAGRTDRLAEVTSLMVTLFGLFFLTRPLILTNLSGGSLQNLLHLPIRRSELLVYSLLTGVVTPLLLESPVLIGAALGAASQPSLILVTLPLALLVHLTLLSAAHSVSLLAVLIARKTGVADAARVFAFLILFMPSFLSYPGPRTYLAPLIGPIATMSPLGWAARATVYAGAGDFSRAALLVGPALLLLFGITFASMSLLNRILAGEGAERVSRRGEGTRRARILLPGALGALVETQLRTQLRTPAARMALLMPTLMMGLFALSLSRRGQPPGGAFAMVIFLSVIGGNSFVVIGRGIALILGTPVSRASLLVASDVSSVIFRIPPLLAIIAVTAWRNGAQEAVAMAALALAVLPIGLGTQHFVSILRPFALPRDRLNPFAQRVDARQSSNGVLSLIATLATGAMAAPFLFLLWLSSRLSEGYGPWLVPLSCLGALATYAILIAGAERLLRDREGRVLEVLLDDSPS